MSIVFELSLNNQHSHINSGPDVNKTCAFSMAHDRCTVRIIKIQNSLNLLINMLFIQKGTYGDWCSTNVNSLGVQISWGRCGEGCPRGENSTWGSDETLRVTTEFKQIKQTSVSDPDIYPALVGLGIMASSLLYIALMVKCFGILKVM